MTYGDSQSVPCPGCAKVISVIDYVTDSCLTEGNTITCPACEREVEVLEVEYTISFTARLQDKYLDWCEMWHRIGRQAEFQARCLATP